MSGERGDGGDVPTLDADAGRTSMDDEPVDTSFLRCAPRAHAPCFLEWRVLIMRTRQRGVDASREA